jgi:hypothetical protein
MRDDYKDNEDVGIDQDAPTRRKPPRQPARPRKRTWRDDPEARAERKAFGGES